MTTQQEQSEFLENKDNTIISPKKPHFWKCCCFPLRTGSLIIGWTYFVESFVVLILLSLILNITITDRYSSRAVIIFTGIMLVATIITIAAYGMVLVGVYKRRPNCLIAFLICISICIVLTFFTQIYQIVKYGFYVHDQYLWSTAVGIGLNILAIFTVDSYRIQLTNELAGYPQPSDLNV